MAVQAGFAEYCRELLAVVGDVEGKRMFGGYGLYVDGLFVALIAEDTLYVKVDEQTRESFERAGCRRFVYDARGTSHSMGYWTVPPEAMDSPQLMLPWANLALAAAKRARDAPPRRKSKR